MCARRTQTTRLIRLPDALRRAIAEEAASRGSTVSTMAAELLEEAIRMRRAPGISFMDGATGRRAVIGGTGLDVWQVVQSWIVEDRSYGSLAANYPWLTPVQLNAALEYYYLYPIEIDERLAREELLTEQYIRDTYPYLTPRN